MDKVSRDLKFEISYDSAKKELTMINSMTGLGTKYPKIDTENDILFTIGKFLNNEVRSIK